MRQSNMNETTIASQKCSEYEVINEIKYTLDEDFLDEMLLTIKENRRG